MSGVLLYKMLPYCIETGSVTETNFQSLNQFGWRTSSQHLLALPPIPVVLELQAHAANSNFYIGAGDSKLGPHACTLTH